MNGLLKPERSGVADERSLHDGMNTEAWAGRVSRTWPMPGMMSDADATARQVTAPAFDRMFSRYDPAPPGRDHHVQTD